MTTEHKRIVGWLLRRMKPYLSLYGTAIGCMCMATLAALAEPLIVKWLFDKVLVPRRPGLLGVAALGFFIISVSALGFYSAGNVASYIASRKLLFTLRLTLLRHLQALSADYYATTPAGEIIFRVEQDAEQIGTVTGFVMTRLIFDCLFVIAVMSIIVILNRPLALLLLLFIPIAIAVGTKLRRRLFALNELTRDLASKRSILIEEYLATIIQAKLLTRERYIAKTFARMTAAVASAEIKERFGDLGLRFTGWGTIAFALAITLGYGGYETIAGALTVGGLVALYSYTLQIFSPIREIQDLYSQMLKGAVSTKRVIEFLGVAPSVVDHPAASPLANTVNSLTFRGVTFGYSASQIILRDISFSILRAERVLLIGPSGVGKSTVAKLLVRLYDPLAGAIYIDSRDLRDITLRSLRSTVVLLPQEAIVFNVSIRENLLYGRANATDAELEQALEAVQLLETVHKFDGRLDHPVGPRGAMLSGGERQRLALARALLQGPQVLVLDEATSAVGLSTEEKLLESLEEYARDTTILLISHRPSVVSWAQKILLFQQDHIVQNTLSPEMAAKICRDGGRFGQIIADGVSNRISDLEMWVSQ